MFREACEREGYTYDPKQAGWLTPIYVAETDEQARRRVRGALLVLRQAAAARHRDQPARLHVAAVDREHPEGPRQLRPEPRDLGPGRRGSVRHRRLARHRVRAARARTSSRLGTGNLLGLFQLGTLPADLTRRNLELFATEVMPRLQGAVPRGRGRSSTQRSRRWPDDGSPPSYVDTHVGKVQVRRGGDGPTPSSTSTRRPARARAWLLLDELADALRRHRADVPRLRRVRGHRADRRHGGRRLPPARPLRPARRSIARPWSGSSLGGWMAAELATRYPERVSRPRAREPGRPLHRRARRSRTSSAARPTRWSPDLFADQQHPMAQLMLPVRGAGRRPRRRAALRDGQARLPDHGGHRPARLGPVPAQPEAAQAAAAGHRRRRWSCEARPTR